MTLEEVWSKGHAVTHEYWIKVKALADAKIEAD